MTYDEAITVLAKHYIAWATEVDGETPSDLPPFHERTWSEIRDRVWEITPFPRAGELNLAINTLLKGA